MDLINMPDVIIADEPTVALDKKTSLEIMKILRELNNQGKTIIILTHDDRIAKQCNTKNKLGNCMLIP